MAKQKKTLKRRPERDNSQTALSVVERAIGGKLVEKPKKPMRRRPARKPRRGKAAKA
jgi:hypothetical protein